MSIEKIRTVWFSNVRGDLLAGVVVALALIPEAIAFSIIAGVDPKVGLYASFAIATLIAFVGGRPGMISAATGAMALVMVTLVKEHGLDYLLRPTFLPVSGSEGFDCEAACAARIRRIANACCRDTNGLTRCWAIRAFWLANSSAC